MLTCPLQYGSDVDVSSNRWKQLRWGKRIYVYDRACISAITSSPHQPGDSCTESLSISYPQPGDSCTVNLCISYPQPGDSCTVNLFISYPQPLPPAGRVGGDSFPKNQYNGSQQPDI